MCPTPHLKLGTRVNFFAFVGICTISGQCGKDNLINQLDLDGAPTEEKNTAKNKARCLGRAREYFNKCEGDSTITATFETKSGVKTSETWPPEKTEGRGYQFMARYKIICLKTIYPQAHKPRLNGVGHWKKIWQWPKLSKNKRSGPISRFF